MNQARDHISLDEQARAVLRGNDRGGYSVPTDGLYRTSGTGTAALPPGALPV
ncbi:hypothetical protein [Thalassobius sp. MITS945101]|uniref:hypothetical protein n=1 Tax=Thalassobius sp. MITS945101 TaxID=3096994 RepID=UPI0039999057